MTIVESSVNAIKAFSPRLPLARGFDQWESIRPLERLTEGPERQG